MKTRIHIMMLALLVVAPALAEEKPAGRVGAGRLRHGAEIGAVAYSGDGKLLATAANDDSVCVFDAASGEVRHRFHVSRELSKTQQMEMNWSGAPPMPSMRLQFSADNHRLFVAVGLLIATFDLDTTKQAATDVLQPNERCAGLSNGAIAVVAGKSSDMALVDLANNNRRIAETAKLPAPDRTTRTVDASSGEQLLWQRETDFPAHAHFTPHGLLATGKFVARLFDPTTGKLRSQWTRDKAGDFAAITFSPDGATLAFVATISPENPAVSRAALIHLDVKNGREREVPSAIVGGQTFAFSPDFTTLAAFGRDGLMLIDVKTGATLRTLAAPARVSRLAFSPDGRTLAGVSGMAVSQWEVASGRRLTASADPAGNLNRLRFLDARRLLVFADELIEYDWKAGALLKRYPLPTHARPAADDVSPDGATVAVCDQYTVRLIDVKTGRTVQDLPGRDWGGGRAVFSADGKRLLFIQEKGGCRTWDIAARKGTRIVGPHHRDLTESFVASPDGRLIAGWVSETFFRINGDMPETNTIGLWDGRTGAKVRDLKLYDSPSGEIVFAPDGRRLAVLTSENAIEMRGFGNTSRVVDDSAYCTIFDPDSGRQVRKLKPPAGGTSSMAFSPDGRALAFGCADGAVVVTEVATGVERTRFTGHKSDVHAIAFSPCGRYLASASVDAPVFVWDLFGTSGTLTPAQLWKDLARDDTSFAAMQRLFAAPDAAIALFREQIKPVAPVPEERMQKLLEALDHPKYAERAHAATELGRVADQAHDRLAKQFAAKETSAEARRLLRRLLERDDEPIVSLRALEVLERLNTPAARALVTEWAGGAPTARFTRASRAALERMKR